MTELHWIYVLAVSFWIGILLLAHAPWWVIVPVGGVVVVVGWVAVAVCIGGSMGAKNKVHK